MVELRRDTSAYLISSTGSAVIFGFWFAHLAIVVTLDATEGWVKLGELSNEKNNCYAFGWNNAVERMCEFSFSICLSIILQSKTGDLHIDGHGDRRWCHSHCTKQP